MGSIIRLIIFTLVAFVAGVLFEKATEAGRCETAGGQRTSEGICVKAGTNG